MDDPTKLPPVGTFDTKGKEGHDGSFITIAVEADLPSPVWLAISFAKSQRDIGVCDKWAEEVTKREGEVLYPTPTQPSATAHHCRILTNNHNRVLMPLIIFWKSPTILFCDES